MNDNPIQYIIDPDPINNNFIVDAYLKSHSYDEPFNHCHPNLYFPEMHKFLTKLLSHSLVMLTCLDNEPDTYFSFVIYQYAGQDLFLHYAYTKSDFRRIGLLKDTIELLIQDDKAQMIITQFPKDKLIFDGLQNKYSHIVFDPFFFTRLV